jgi:hypothetical protein
MLALCGATSTLAVAAATTKATLTEARYTDATAHGVGSAVRDAEKIRGWMVGTAVEASVALADIVPAAPGLRVCTADPLSEALALVDAGTLALAVPLPLSRTDCDGDTVLVVVKDGFGVMDWLGDGGGRGT